MQVIIITIQEGREALSKLQAMADKLGVDIGELLQMVISLQQAFASGSASSNGWQIFERIAGQFATGAGQGVASGVTGLLGNSAAQGVGRALLQNGQGLGGSKKKRKTYRKQKKMRRKHKKSSKRK
jgi:hypothetical protein